MDWKNFAKGETTSHSNNDDKPPKNRGGCLKWVLIVFGILILISACGAMLDTESDTNNEGTESEDNQTEEIVEEEQTEEEKREEQKERRAELAEQREKEKQEKEAKEAKDKAEKEKEEQAKKEQDEKEKEEQAKQKKLDAFQHEVIEDVDVYTSFSDIVISPNNYMSNFSIDATDLLKEIHQDLNNGVVFRNATTLTDKYGNEDKSIVVSVWYSQETIERINFENWPQLIGEDLYNTADGVIVHYALGQEVDVDNKQANENAPNIYRDSIGAEYKE